VRSTSPRGGADKQDKHIPSVNFDAIQRKRGRSKEKGVSSYFQ
jgi:hypothetical protein